MKFIDKADESNPVHYLELTECNLRSLLEKLNNPESSCTLMDRHHKIIVKAVPDAEHYSDREPGPTILNGEIV